MTAERIELPLFPLNTVLFPGGLLPLKVFEQRYVEMTKRCVRDGTSFGVCLIREGREVGDPAVPALLGCTARIDEWDVPHPNIFHLVAHGERRFRILRTEVAALGLLLGEAELLLPETTAQTAPDPLCRSVLASVVEHIGAERFPGPIRMDDPAWISYRLAEVLPLSTEIRQQLLETDAAERRLEMLHDMLVAAGVTNAG
jgi:Lon protease-like protein